ncbi:MULTISPECIES: monovalent cation/H(+) antiporter subunit G [unclassified Methylobacterium]|uniref:monovalent cation/H(+) antiporter subunit G n=1 Tax=unclassified Methylobacterium TaxID=2615210 RepID=UPI0006FFA2D1|nr:MULTISPECIES: monovalent cation/H(+) antiporter subunit G [unclassified Methylobacterium]KQP92327.1 potassium:proton antiporter [Methylobacterium sp. Leaf113]KQP95983.1 potassium:proton antiporter [Methylobacterium sp. Leaf117]MCK2053013.1 cation:proton antiporter [Methylobacterium sp. 37f]
MTGAALPVWAAWLVVALAITGAGFSLTGALGLIRLRTFYERVHAPTLGATLGMALILTSSMVLLSLIEGRLVLRDALIGIFLTITTPVTLLVLARAAAQRDRHEGNPGAPPEL